ncbi:hypothetical protein RAS1_17490 [Phycisphaerae bacterium RAS1]|nr:hypothetical protein RAS1_17490 [Phycisphaerae bacterium RAS1]
MMRTSVVTLYTLSVAAALAAAAGGPEFRPGPHPMPVNRCQFSRVCIQPSSAAAGAPNHCAEDLAATDDDPATAAAISAGGDDALEVRFIGAPRWVNQVRVATNAAAFQVEVLDLFKTWRFFGAGVSAGDGSPVDLLGPDSRVLGVRFVPLQSGTKDGAVLLFELSAYFEQVDADGGAAPRGAGSLYYEWINNYPSPSSDLSRCDNDARGLRDQLGWGWQGFGDSDAWEEDFKRDDVGGTNSGFSDAFDLAYFSGHGSSTNDWYYKETRRTLKFGNDDHDDAHTVPGDGRGAWGNGEMEWMAFNACQTMKDWDNRDDWFQCMDGLHLVLGWKTNAKDVNHGYWFGRFMVDNGAFDSAEKVRKAWFHAADFKHGSGYTAFVIGETESMGNDYAWGEGSVNNDPTHNGAYHWWSYDTGAGGGQREGEQPQDAGPQPPPQDAVAFERQGERGLRVLISSTLLAQRGAPTQMPRYTAVPQNIDPAYVRAIADDLCAATQTFCNADIGYDDDQMFINSFDGAYQLRVCATSGGVELQNTAAWMEPVAAPPNLPSASVAPALADNLLSQLQLMPPGAVVTGVDYAYRGEREEVGGTWQHVPGSVFPTAVRVKYQRRLGPSNQWIVSGPGGGMTVALGEGGQMQRIFRAPWRPVTTGPMVNLVPLSTIIAALSTQGADATIDGITADVQTIQIDEVAYGYYEHACDEMQPTLRPAYILNVTLTEQGGDTSTDMLHVWADAPPLRADILSPMEPICVPPGQQLCFQGRAVGGVPPYTLSWDDHIDGDLGAGGSVCHAFAAGAGAPRPQNRHTVRLRVTDSMGAQSTDYVVVCVALPGDMNCDGAVNILDINPLVLALSDPAAYAAQFPDCDISNGDINGDGQTNILDINPFVALVSGG